MQFILVWQYVNAHCVWRPLRKIALYLQRLTVHIFGHKNTVILTIRKRSKESQMFLSLNINQITFQWKQFLNVTVFENLFILTCSIFKVWIVNCKCYKIWDSRLSRDRMSVDRAPAAPREDSSFLGRIFGSTSPPREVSQSPSKKPEVIRWAAFKYSKRLFWKMFYHLVFLLLFVNFWFVLDLFTFTIGSFLYCVT